MRTTVKISLLVLVIGLVGCDHATKYAAEAHLENRPSVDVVTGVLDLQYTENRDSAFSLLSWMPQETRLALMRTAGVIVILAMLLLWTRRRASATWVEHAAFAVLVAGALGNLIDRFARGYVVDFIHLHYWPIFNVADACIVAGVALLFLANARPRTSLGAEQQLQNLRRKHDT